MLHLRESAYLAMIAHAYDGLPDEACGLIAGPTHDQASTFVACENVDRSSRTFSLGPDAWEAIDELEGKGLTTLGVVHSHTHTEAYPSPTDIDQASNPFLTGWRWVLVSLRQDAPVVRSYVITDGKVVEEPIALLRG